jgi:hypothetical protein
MTASCRACGRQVEVSDSGQPMPCICIRRPSEAFLLDCVADCVGPAAPEPEHPCICEFVVSPALCRAAKHLTGER